MRWDELKSCRERKYDGSNEELISAIKSQLHVIVAVVVYSVEICLWVG